MLNYAIIENELVINTVIADEQYAQSQGWVLLTNNAGIGWSYKNGQFIEPLPTAQEIQAQNKTQATTLLSQTDWTATVDISNPQYSNPYLTNQDAFLTYRSAVRNIAVNPPTTPAIFPEQPVATWSS